MKRLQQFTLIIFLIIISCTNNPAIEKRYALEKSYFKAEKKYETVNPATENNSNNELITQYENIVSNGLTALESLDSIVYPTEYRHIAQLVSKSSTRLHSFYIYRKDVAKSRGIYHQLTNTLHLSSPRQAEFSINLARSFQSAGIIDSAFYYYLLTLKDYYPPVEESGEIITIVFSLPLYLHSLAFRLNDTILIRQQTEMAEDYYLQLSQLENNIKLNKSARLNLLFLYEKEKMWDKELTVLNSLLDPGEPEYHSLLFKTAGLLTNKFGQNDSALVIYNTIISNSNPADTLEIPKALFAIAQVELNKKNYSKVRKLLSNLKNNYPDYFSSNSIHQFTYAKAFELDGNWDRAESEYNLLIEKYRGSTEAMKSLLYVYDKLITQNRTIKAGDWFEKSEKYFIEIAHSYQGSETAALAQIFNADLQTRIDNWDKSAEILLSVFNHYPDLDIGTKAAVKAANIYREKLNNDEKADLIIAELRTKLNLNR